MAAPMPARTAAAARPRVSRAQAVGLLALGNTLWAGTYVAGKVALEQLSWVQLNAVRFSLATLLLAPVLWRGRHLIAVELRDVRSVWGLARLVLLGFVLNKAFEYAGLSLTTAADTALLIATESLFTALLSWTVLRERVSRLGVAALLVGLAGVYLVVERGIVPNLGGPGGVGRVVGDLLIVLALVFEAGYTISGKSSLDRLPPLLLIACSIGGSLLVWVPAGAVAVGLGGWPHPTWLTVLAVGYMAAVATVAGYWIWFRALSAVDASLAAPTLFIQPLVGAVLAIVLLHETVGVATIAGALLIALSLLLVVNVLRRQRAVPDEPQPPVGEAIP